MGSIPRQMVFAASKLGPGFIRSERNSNELGGTGVEAREEPTLELRFGEMVPAWSAE